MFEQYRITNCKALNDYKVEITFADGVSGIADLKHLSGKGVFKIWDDYGEFKKVFIHPFTKTLCWADELDLDPINLKNHLVQKN
jgi:hypothetical protein